MTVDLAANKKLSHIVTELFSKVRKLNISLVLIPQSYFKGFKTIKLNLENASRKYLTKWNFNKLH